MISIRAAFPRIPAGQRPLGALALAVVLLCGCSRLSMPAGTLGATVSVEVYSEAWHTVLVLPDAQGVEEWSYGEKRWFMEGHNSLWRAPRVLFWRGKVS